MAISSLSKQQRFIALIAAVALVSTSWLYFRELSPGVAITGAGDSNVNGYYKWYGEYGGGLYLKNDARRSGGWRVPNVYEMATSKVSRSDGKSYLYSPGFTESGEENRERQWILQSDGKRGYESVEGGVLSNTPPATGWKAVEGYEPPPEVNACGNNVPNDPDSRVKQPSGNMQTSRAFEMGEFPAEIVAHPVTTLLLAANLLYAYYLWSRRVSPDAVAISYALFWEEKQYWRLFTASFSHFEPLHLLFNALGTWNTRYVESMLGSFQLLYLTLDLVVTTIVAVTVVKYFLVRGRGAENHRSGKAVGFSCVLFAHMTYLAVANREFCPISKGFCFTTWSIPMPGDIPPLAVNLGPFASLLLAQMIMPRAGFLGHLAGILMGYLMAWRLLESLSTPILAGISVLLMLEHSKGWARNMPDFSLLLQGWAGGDAFRVTRARTLTYVLVAHLCVTLASLCLLTWSSGLAEGLALVVGFNALQALKCCCCPDSVPSEHRYCVNLLKAYGVLSVILVVGDLLSFGAVLSLPCFLGWSGVSEASRHLGLGLMIVAAAVHGLAVMGCVEDALMFRDGQVFLSNVGLGYLATTYSVNAGIATSRSTSSSEGTSGRALSYARPAGIASGSLYRGGGRALGTAASNRAQHSAAMRGPGPNASRAESLERAEGSGESGRLLVEERREREGNRGASVHTEV